MEIVYPVSDIFWGTGTKDKKGRDMFGALLQNLLKIKIRSPERLGTIHTHLKYQYQYKQLTGLMH